MTGIEKIRNLLALRYAELNKSPSERDPIALREIAGRLIDAIPYLLGQVEAYEKILGSVKPIVQWDQAEMRATEIEVEQ